jgi:hypothetical protein
VRGGRGWLCAQPGPPLRQAILGLEVGCDCAWCSMLNVSPGLSGGPLLLFLGQAKVVVLRDLVGAARGAIEAKVAPAPRAAAPAGAGGKENAGVAAAAATTTVAAAAGGAGCAGAATAPGPTPQANARQELAALAALMG